MCPKTALVGQLILSPDSCAWNTTKIDRSWVSSVVQDTDEIGFRQGDVIRVLDNKGDWWKGSVNGKTGL